MEISIVSAKREEPQSTDHVCVCVCVCVIETSIVSAKREEPQNIIKQCQQHHTDTMAFSYVLTYVYI
jgi:hypothetical protein